MCQNDPPRVTSIRTVRGILLRAVANARTVDVPSCTRAHIVVDLSALPADTTVVIVKSGGALIGTEQLGRNPAAERAIVERLRFLIATEQACVIRGAASASDALDVSSDLEPTPILPPPA
jgi:hypothetical protein